MILRLQLKLFLKLKVFYSIYNFYFKKLDSFTD